MATKRRTTKAKPKTKKRQKSAMACTPVRFKKKGKR